MRLQFVVTILVIMISGCTTTLPLCSKVAHYSYNPPDDSSNVNSYIRINSEKMGITIYELSAFAAEYTGSPSSINWLEKHYAEMICGFDPSKVANDKAVYMSCTQHAPEWIRIFDGANKENLFLSETLYKENCVR